MKRPAPVETRLAADLPDAALVAACDTSDRPTATNGDLADELSRTRQQRNGCAAQVDGVRTWREQAAERIRKSNPRP